MTKRTLPPLVEDPTQPEFVRDLVQAGRDQATRNADVSGYDFEQGFRKHLALVASGAPMPPWAESLTHGAPSAAGTGVAPAAAAGTGAIGWLAGSAVGVAIVSAVWFASQSQPATPAVPGRAPVGVQVGVQSASPASDQPVSAPVLEPAAPGESRGPREAGRTSHDRSPTSIGNTRGKHADKRSAPAVRGAGTDLFVAPQSPDTRAPRAATEGAQPQRLAQSGAPAERETTKAHGSAPQQAAPQQAAPQEAEPQHAEQEAAAQREAAPREDGKLEREMAMLSMTQRVLDNDPKRALSLARQGEAEFPGSMFTQERQQLLLLALVKLGKVDDARRLAKPFLLRYPTGPFSDRVRRALAAGNADR